MSKKCPTCGMRPRKPLSTKRMVEIANALWWVMPMLYVILQMAVTIAQAFGRTNAFR